MAKKAQQLEIVHFSTFLLEISGFSVFQLFVLWSRIRKTHLFNLFECTKYGNPWFVWSIVKVSMSNAMQKTGDAVCQFPIIQYRPNNIISSSASYKSSNADKCDKKAEK